MKALWTGLCVLAIANLLGIFGVVGWLFTSGRLDKARMTRLREVLSETVGQEASRLETAAATVEAQSQDAAVAERELQAPLSAAEQLHVRLDLSEVDHQRIERLRQETADLSVAVDRDQQRLAAERRAFAAEQAAFAAMRAQLADVEGSAQFRKAVGTLQGLKAEDAVAILMEILASGSVSGADDVISSGEDSSEGIPVMSGGPEQVVSYLNAMAERSRNKIMSEIATSDPALAADLLERLRTRGQFARVPESAAP